MEVLLFLVALYVLITLTLILNGYDSDDDFDITDVISIIKWPKYLADKIGYKESIGINTIIGVCLGIFYVLLFTGNAEMLTHFYSQTQQYKEDYLLRADDGLGFIILFPVIGTYLITVAPGFWVLIGYNLNFMAMLAIISF